MHHLTRASTTAEGSRCPAGTAQAARSESNARSAAVYLRPSGQCGQAGSAGSVSDGPSDGPSNGTRDGPATAQRSPRRAPVQKVQVIGLLSLSGSGWW
jgi:hypothetical protein